jgi:hypothetical protein
LLEADFGLAFGRPARTTAHNAAERRVSVQGYPGSGVNLNREDKAEEVGGGDVSPTDTKQYIEHARRTAVRFEFALIFVFLV